MRSSTHCISRVPWATFGAAALLIALAGCGSTPERADSPVEPEDDTPNASLSALLGDDRGDETTPVIASEPSEPGSAVPEGDALAEALRLQAERALEMQVLLDTASPTGNPETDPSSGTAPPEVSLAELAQDDASPGDALTTAEFDEAADDAPAAALAEATPDPAPTVEELADRLVRMLADEAAAQPDPARELATIAALEPLLPGVLGELREKDPEAFSLLLEPQSRVLEQLSTLAEAFSSGDPERAASAAREAADTLAQAAPLTLPHVELCRRVEGFGRYTPLGRQAFLAGREHPAIVYAEVDRFSREGDDRGGYAVRLSLELEIRHAKDDLLAWRRSPQSVVETSRRPLRDFFLVSRIDLPPSLTVGRYVLKVIVRDELRPGSMAEGRIPFRVVADPRLTWAEE